MIRIRVHSQQFFCWESTKKHKFVSFCTTTIFYKCLVFTLHFLLHFCAWLIMPAKSALTSLIHSMFYKSSFCPLREFDWTYKKGAILKILKWGRFSFNEIGTTKFIMEKMYIEIAAYKLGLLKLHKRFFFICKYQSHLL